MDEARRLLERIGRIEALAGGSRTQQTLLPELRALVSEAEAWARREGGAEAGTGGALDNLRRAAHATAVAGLPAQNARGP